jgi:hypothetical protein
VQDGFALDESINIVILKLQLTFDDQTNPFKKRSNQYKKGR